jgi:hypothetical protein
MFRFGCPSPLPYARVAKQRIRLGEAVAAHTNAS